MVYSIHTLHFIIFKKFKLLEKVYLNRLAKQQQQQQSIGLFGNKYKQTSNHAPLS